VKKYFFIILLSDYANAQDPTFSDPINNRSYSHPTSLTVLKGIEGGGNYQTNMVGVLPIIRTGYCYFNGSYKVDKGVYIGHGLSYLNDSEGKNPQIKTSSFKANIINFRWFYKKYEGLNCDNYQNKPFIAMGLYLGWFTKSLNTGDLVFSKQIEAWSSTPVLNNDYSLYNRQTRADIGGNLQFKFPISKLLRLRSDAWSGNISASVHHLQSPRNSVDANTEASFVKNGAGVSLPRYSVYSFSLINTDPTRLTKEFYAQIETQTPIKRIVIGTHFFIDRKLSIGAAFSSYNIEHYRKNVNTFIVTINFISKKTSTKGVILRKFFISYTSVLSGLGYAPMVNKFGSIQVGFKLSKNNDCNFKTTICNYF
jgi:hypothetical protein